MTDLDTSPDSKTQSPSPYQPKHKLRFVTATSLFDGHDASINIFRRILQASGTEVVHLGHNRSVQEIVECAIEEDAQGIAITSYQGGHNEFFRYMRDLLVERGCEHVRIFGGGGGVILPSEIQELMDYGVTRLYSPDDGRNLGLQGMIDDMLEKSDFANGIGAAEIDVDALGPDDKLEISRLISAAEEDPQALGASLEKLRKRAAASKAPVLGITGTGGSGKSSFVDEFVRRFLIDHKDKRIAVISVDPSKRKTGGALLGDRIRMNAIHHERCYMRSLATRQANLALSPHVSEAVRIVRAAGYDLVLLETSGIGQSDTEITEHSDVSLYAMTAEYGAATQLEKIDMLDFADLIVINKFDKRGALDALRDVRKQYKRNHKLFDTPDEELPVFGTIASQFNDPGTNKAYQAILAKIAEKCDAPDFVSKADLPTEASEKVYVIPPQRTRYLSEISEQGRAYDEWVEKQSEVAAKIYRMRGAIEELDGDVDPAVRKVLEDKLHELELQLDGDARKALEEWPAKAEQYRAEEFVFKVRDKEIRVTNYHESLSHTKLPKIALPKYRDEGDLLKWLMRENVPGEFPFTAGVFPFKRVGEDPTRMFAGEGGPERTNRRFHYVSEGMPAKRLSTAFDSVTLYGEDPDERPDIYGKIGNAGVAICTLDDAKKLYSGFDLCDPKTSVSMTINGPAPMLLGFFLNSAIDQQCELYIKEHGLEADVEAALERKFDDQGLPRPSYQGQMPPSNNGLGLMLLGLSGDEVLPPNVYAPIKERALQSVRGTVQADILKEDQAQNTCIFSTEFALQDDGRHPAVLHRERRCATSTRSRSAATTSPRPERTRSRSSPSRSPTASRTSSTTSRAGCTSTRSRRTCRFFFSNGLDPEYSVIGRVARRIWAKAIKRLYGGNERSQKLKYHIQTSGRSLHAQEIAFNDIRTTLQALYAIYDNCNSLHTNAYDEAITTPTEESVRRAMAIQLIINRELGSGEEREPDPGRLHHRRADRPGRGGGAARVRAPDGARRRARRDGDDVPARQDPGRVAATTRR
jgi:methylmalonyl-CoA mutase